ncbi:MAG TPA: cytochrome c-type biogenesis protein CcmH [Acidimicrobiales bacterium]|nr:cytochrome c-type biogenesis protein CcmH [Acidimicrobiales bacterium]
MRRWLPWLALVVVVGATLVAGGRGGPPAEPEERVRSIAATVRCPTCAGQSAAASNAAAATNIRGEIARRVAEGQGDDEIRAALASSYGEWILLNPPRGGVAGLVWVLPVAALLGTAAALGLAFRRRRVPAIDEDRAAFAAARSPRGGWPRQAAVVVAVVTLAVGAGVAVAASSGTRLPGETFTGEIRPTASSELRRAALLAQEGQVREALEVYDGLLEDDPDNVEALGERGLLLVSLGQATGRPVLLEAGKESVERALALRPDDPRSLFYLGLALRLEGDDRGAEDAFARALDADPPPALRESIESFLSTTATPDTPTTTTTP